MASEDTRAKNGPAFSLLPFLAFTMFGFSLRPGKSINLREASANMGFLMSGQLYDSIL
jgi:hypothetical protein